MHPDHSHYAATCELLQLDLLAKISTSTRAVLELDVGGQSLQVWPWWVELFLSATSCEMSSG